MPSTPLTIVEILERSEQGQTRPFLCRCEDDRLYYVKGRDAGQRGLLCEWLAGHLGRELGLPLPEFNVVQADQSLIDLHPEGRDLGSMPAFGSLKVEHTQELTISHLKDIDACLQCDLLVFDWWVKNEDRTLTTLSGNPNLLWNASESRLVVIDHNLAFDPGFSAGGFSETHIFREHIPKIFHDLAERGRYAQRLREALAVWPKACNNAPSEWWFADEERTVPTDLDSATSLALLNRCANEDFWKLTP